MGPLLIIDGFNVLHAGVLTGRDRANWWRASMQHRLIERVESCTETASATIWIVFDRRTDTHTEYEDVTSNDRRISVFYAPSADDWIVTRVSELAGQRAVTVVTADRLLRERVQLAGGILCSPTRFLATCG